MQSKKFNNFSIFFNFSIIILFLFSVISCNNFLTGAELREQLESTIAYANAPTYKILVQADKDCGQLKKPITGELNQKVTDIFEIKFEPVTDYTFMRWEASSEYLPEGERIKDYIEFEEPGNPETKVHFKKALNSIVITAVCPHLPYVDFALTSTNYTYVDLKGEFIPSVGTHRCTDTHTYTLSYDPFTDWEFVRWEIYDAKTKQIIPNDTYIHIENPESKTTTYSFTAAPVDQEIQVAVRPIIAERPQIISYAPMGSDINKDTSIQVMFDKEIDPSSIYYTEEEMQEMIDNGEADSPLYPGTVDEKTIYKGYIKDNKNYFKNIMIKNQRIPDDDENNNNINHYFLSPYIENGVTLIIPVNKKQIVGYTQILVSIDKGIRLKTYNNVEMSSGKKWTYLVNNKIDTRPIFIVNDEDHPYEAKYSAAGKSLPIEYPPEIDNDGNGIESLNFMDDTSIYLNARLHNNTVVAGMPNTFKVQIQKLYDASYTKVNNSTIQTKEITYTNREEYDADFAGTIDLSDKLNTDGVYSINFLFSDTQGHELEYPEGQKYYITRDTKPVTEISDYNISYDKTNKKITLSWKNTAPCKDIYYVVNLKGPDGVDHNESLYLGTQSTITQVFEPKDLPEAYYTYSVTAHERRGNKSSTQTKFFLPSSHLFDLVYVKGYNGTYYNYYSNSKIFTYSTNIYNFSNLLVCEHEVTQNEYEKYMFKSGTNNIYSYDYNYTSGYGSDVEFPAYYVTYLESLIYCNLRSVDEGLTPVYSLYKQSDNKTKDVDTWVTLFPEVIKEYNGKYYVDSQASYSYTINCDTDNNANGYRLLTEQEWEYCARNGQKNDTYYYSGSDTPANVAWYNYNSGNSNHMYQKSHPIKQKNPNELGLYDMSGNVAEWVFSNGVSSSKKTMLRGGSYLSGSNSVDFPNDEIKVFYQKNFNCMNRDKTNGFRVARTCPELPSEQQ